MESQLSSPEISHSQNEDLSMQCTVSPSTLDEALIDVADRFIVNLPDAELADISRICFQIEQAHWYYEDFLREANAKLPQLQLKNFSALMFKKCSLLQSWDHEQAFENFMQYKIRVPVCGAIMINETWDKARHICLLVKGWKSSAGWGFPKGKINEGEPKPACAIREVLEETGYDLAGQIVLDDVIEVTVKEQVVTLFVVGGIPEDFNFRTRTRKEISNIAWFNLTDLPMWKRNKVVPGKFYLITTFIPPLKGIVNKRKRFLHPTAKNMFNGKQTPTTPLKQEERQDSNQRPGTSQSPFTGDSRTPSPPQSQRVEPSLQGHYTPPEDVHFAKLLKGLVMSAEIAPPNSFDDAANEIRFLSPSPEVPASSTGVRRNQASTEAPEAVHHENHQNSPARRNSSPNQSPPTPTDTSSSSVNFVALSPPPSGILRPQKELESTSSSVRQLQQRALLESLAGESAHISVSLPQRRPEAPTHRDSRPSTSVRRVFSDPREDLPGSVPPIMMSNPRADVLYSTAQPRPQNTNFVTPIVSGQDPFGPRPWTSNALHSMPPFNYTLPNASYGPGLQPSLNGYGAPMNFQDHSLRPRTFGQLSGPPPAIPLNPLPFRVTRTPVQTFSGLNNLPQSAPAFAPGFTFPLAFPTTASHSYSEELLTILKSSPVVSHSNVNEGCQEP